MTPHTIFLIVMGAPYESELTTTLFRLLDAALARGHRLIVWSCGASTTLTLESLGECKPRNVMRHEVVYPSTARLVRTMMARYGERLEWHICQQCMEERGTTGQIEGVRIQPPFRFLRYLDQADVCMSMGIK
jgi:hypothetical protein